jgi:signal transduction histidine kinase
MRLGGEGRSRADPILLGDPGSAEQLAEVSTLAVMALGTIGILGLAGTTLVALSSPPPSAGYHPLAMAGLAAAALVMAGVGRRHREVFSPARQVYFLPVAAVALATAAYLAGPIFAPLVAMFFLWFGSSVTYLPRRAALALMTWVGLAFATVLIIQPGHYQPLARWGTIIWTMVAAAVVLNRLVDRSWTLARGEQDARAEAEQARIELEVVSERKSRFLARMSHELRTPLNAIIGFSDVLAQRCFGELNPEQAEYVDDVVDAGRHLLALVNDLLDLAKVETGAVELDVGRVELTELLGSSLALFKEQAGRRRVVLTLDVDPGSGTIEADARKLKQVVFNLLANALKFTPDGGQVAMGARGSGDRVRIWVSDNGPGIVPEDRESIFEEFRQGARAGEGGTGLGLPLARRLVELHGGRLWVESEIGAGSTFTAELPIRPRPQTAVETSRPAGERPVRLILGEPDSPRRRVETARLILIITGTMTALGVLALTINRLNPVPELARYHEGPLAIITTLGLVVVGAILIRPAWVGTPEVVPYVGAIGVATTSTAIWALGSGVGDYAAILYGWVGAGIFLVVTRREWITHVVLIGAGYGVVLTLQDGHAAPLASWVTVMGLSVVTGHMVRRFVARIEALALAQRAARSEAERVGVELVVASRNKTEFLANMSHELRTPLNVINGFAEVLASGAFGPLNPKQAEYVADVLESGRHLLGIINNILDLAKADAGRMELQLRELNLEVTLATVLMPFERDAVRRRIDLRLAAVAGLGSVEGDEAKLVQALGHLVSNALKFTPDGGRVTVQAAHDGDHVEITVADTGRGIGPDDQQRIFDAFAHGDEALATEQGSGLGLALARRYAELHGGSLTVMSAIGAGATFSLHLPRQRVRAEPAEVA